MISLKLLFVHLHRSYQKTTECAAAGSQNSRLVPVPIPRLRSLIAAALRHQGHSDSDDITCISDLLVFAELRGNNQGIIKLVNGDLKPSPYSSYPSTEVIHESAVSAKLDGKQRPGMRVMKDSLDVALKKAKSSGICVVGVSNYSSATGALGYWAREASRKGYISVVMSMCPEYVAPHGSHEPLLGTNPVAIGFPTIDHLHPLVLDMATSRIAWYAVVTAAALGKPLPSDDAAYDSEGHATTDPNEVLSGGALRPFDLSYKGSHLGLMVELLAGAWTGAAVVDKKVAGNWGSLIVVIDPSVLEPSDQGRKRLLEDVDRAAKRIKSAKKLPGVTEIYLPGERGDVNEARSLEAGVVNIDANLLRRLEVLGLANRDE